MARNRKEFIDFVCTHLDELLPGGENGKYIRQRLEAMSPEQLDAYVEKLASGEETIPLVAPNLHDKKLSIENNIKVAKKLGYDFFHHLRLTDPETGTTYLTPEKYLVVDLPVRRQRQLQRKKITIPQGTRHVDELSGQVTGPSRGSKISMPELQVLYSQDLTQPIVELIKYRGGDIKGQQLLYRSLMETGRASQKALSMTPTAVRSTQVLGIIFNAMHLSTTLND
jgi:hypothetical protein